jgi:hypothetical protein
LAPHAVEGTFGFARDIVGGESGGHRLAQRGFAFIVQKVVVKLEQFLRGNPGRLLTLDS